MAQERAQPQAAGGRGGPGVLRSGGRSNAQGGRGIRGARRHMMDSGADMNEEWFETTKEEARLIQEVIEKGYTWLGEDELRQAGLGLEDMQRVLYVARAVKEAQGMNEDNPEVREQERAANRRENVRNKLVSEAKESLGRIIGDDGKLIESQDAVNAFRTFIRLPSFYHGVQEELIRQRRGAEVAGIQQLEMGEPMERARESQRSQRSDGEGTLAEMLQRIREEEEEEAHMFEDGGEEGLLSKEKRRFIYEQLARSVGKGVVALKDVIRGKRQLPLSKEVIDVLRGLFPAAEEGAYEKEWPIVEEPEDVEEINYSDIWNQLVHRSDLAKGPVDYFGWTAKDMLTLVMAGREGDCRSVAGKFVALLVLISKGQGPDEWWVDLRTALGEALDKTKPFGPQPAVGDAPKVRPLGKMPAFLTMINGIYMHKGDADRFSDMASVYQLSKKEQAGTEIMALMVQACLKLHDTPCVLVHDAKNAYNTLSLDAIWRVVAGAKGRDMYRRFYSKSRRIVFRSGLTPHLDLLIWNDSLSQGDVPGGGIFNAAQGKALEAVNKMAMCEAGKGTIFVAVSDNIMGMGPGKRVLQALYAYLLYGLEPWVKQALMEANFAEEHINKIEEELALEGALPHFLTGIGLKAGPGSEIWVLDDEDDEEDLEECNLQTQLRVERYNIGGRANAKVLSNLGLQLVGPRLAIEEANLRAAMFVVRAMDAVWVELKRMKRREIEPLMYGRSLMVALFKMSGPTSMGYRMRNMPIWSTRSMVAYMDKEGVKRMLDYTGLGQNELVKELGRSGRMIEGLAEWILTPTSKGGLGLPECGMTRYAARLGSLAMNGAVVVKLLRTALGEDCGDERKEDVVKAVFREFEECVGYIKSLQDEELNKRIELVSVKDLCEQSQGGLQTDLSRLMAAKRAKAFSELEHISGRKLWDKANYHKAFYKSTTPTPREQSGVFQAKAMLSAWKVGKAVATGIHALFPTKALHFEDEEYVCAVLLRAVMVPWYYSRRGKVAVCCECLLEISSYDKLHCIGCEPVRSANMTRLSAKLDHAFRRCIPMVFEGELLVERGQPRVQETPEVIIADTAVINSTGKRLVIDVATAMVDSESGLHPSKPLRCLEYILAKKAETYRNHHNVKVLAVSAMGAIGEHGMGVFSQVATMFLEASKDPTAGERRAWLLGKAKAITGTGLQREWVRMFMDWAVEKIVRRVSRGVVFVSKTLAVEASPNTVLAFEIRMPSRGQAGIVQGRLVVPDDEVEGKLAALNDLQTLQEFCNELSPRQCKTFRPKIRQKVCQVLRSCEESGTPLRREHRKERVQGVEEEGGGRLQEGARKGERAMVQGSGEEEVAGAIGEARREVTAQGEGVGAGGARQDTSPQGPRRPKGKSTVMQKGTPGARKERREVGAHNGQGTIDLGLALASRESKFIWGDLEVGRLLDAVQQVKDRDGNRVRFIKWDEVAAIMIPGAGAMSNEDKEKVRRRLKRKYDHLQYIGKIDAKVPSGHKRPRSDTVEGDGRKDAEAAHDMDIFDSDVEVGGAESGRESVEGPNMSQMTEAGEDDEAEGEGDSRRDKEVVDMAGDDEGSTGTWQTVHGMGISQLSHWDQRYLMRRTGDPEIDNWSNR